MKKRKDINELIEILIQQTSAHNSDLKRDIGVIKEKITTLDVTVNRVEAQTIKTNGRVTILESESTFQKGSRNGGWKVWSIAGFALIALVGTIYAITVNNINARINDIQRAETNKPISAVISVPNEYCSLHHCSFD